MTTQMTTLEKERHYNVSLEYIKSDDFAQTLHEATTSSLQSHSAATSVALTLIDAINSLHHTAIDEFGSDNTSKTLFEFDDALSAVCLIAGKLKHHPDSYSKIRRHLLVSRLVNSTLIDYHISDKISKKSEPCSVKTYFIFNKLTKLYKIGKSTRVSERVNELSNSCGVGLKIVYICNHNIEEELHKKFAKFRKVGEWFALPETVVEEVICIMKAS